MKKIITLSIFGVLLTPFFVSAGPIVRGGESISVDASQTLEGDFYGFASTVIISGSAVEDVYVGGRTVTVNAPIQKDLTVVGGSVQVHGEVGDDLRIAGGDVVLATPVKGDVVVVGGSLTILSTASVGGDVLFWGGALVIDGAVQGSVHGSAEDVRINAMIAGGVEYSASQSFALGDKAYIKEDIAYTGYSDIARAQGAVVEGDVQHIDAPFEDTKSLLKMYLIVLGLIVFSVSATYLLARNIFERLATKPLATFGGYGLIGLAVLVLTPFVISVLIVSVIGILVGVMVLMGYVALLISSVILSIMIIGYTAQKALFKKSVFTLYTLLLGSCVFLSVLYIPMIGPFIVFGLSVVSFGIMVQSLYNALRE